MAGRVLGDATYYVSRRVGRSLARYDLLPDGVRTLAFFLDGSREAGLALELFRLRNIWVPRRFRNVALLGEAMAGSERQGWCAFCEGRGVEVIGVPALPGEPAVCFGSIAEPELPVIVLPDCIEDACARVLGSVLLDGRLSRLAESEPTGGPLLIRPFLAISREKLLLAAAECGVPGDPACRPRFSEPERLALLEGFLGQLPGARMDLLTNIAQSATQIRSGYLA